MIWGKSEIKDWREVGRQNTIGKKSCKYVKVQNKNKKNQKFL